MDRAARAKKPSKAASALESLRAIKAGEAKAIDNLELEDEDAVYEEDDAAGREYEEATPEDQCPKKRKHETGRAITSVPSELCSPRTSSWISQTYLCPPCASWAIHVAVRPTLAVHTCH